MTNSLVRCSTCKRHIYASETTCPFCIRAGTAMSGNLAVALTAAASIALAGCANDPPKNDAATEASPEARKAEPSQAAPNPTPPQVVVPTPPPAPIATEPAPTPSASTAATPTATPRPPATPDPRVAPVPAYGLPRPTATQTAPRKPPAAYGAPPPPGLF